MTAETSSKMAKTGCVNPKPRGVLAAKRRKQKLAQYEAAISYMKLHSCSGVIALRTGASPLIGIRSLQRRVAGTVSNGEDPRTLLTTQESLLLAIWVKECADGLQPVTRKRLGSEVCELLRVRDRRNKRSKGRKYAKLSMAATRCLENKTPHTTWFQEFYEKHSDIISEKKPVVAERKRVIVYT